MKKITSRTISPPEQNDFQSAKKGIDSVIQNIRSVITIQQNKLEYILAAKMAGGHVILADAHGVGKTSLARALSGSIKWKEKPSNKAGLVRMEPFNRIQCTVDLLPQDILGYNRFDLKTGKQFFNKGPIFSHFVLCDEINLLTPKTQGSFLQVMEEKMVSIEGESYHLAEPFFIIATMNLKGAHLFPLPAPQLDRFMIRLSLGYPDMEDEISIIHKHGNDNAWDDFTEAVTSEEFLLWQKMVDHITIQPEVIEYIVRLVRKTRNHPGIITGASPRAGIKLSRAARALALVRGKNYTDIDLVKELAPAVLAHRIETDNPSRENEEYIEDVLKEIRA